jgi:acyl-CoA thioester hydrolase
MADESSLTRFFFPIRVRFADTDLQGHVFFGNYYTYMDEAYMAYIEMLGFSWEILEQMGMAIYYVDSGCQFKAPSFYGEQLNVYAEISALGNSSMTAAMTVVRERNREVVATGFIKGVMVDTSTEKSTPIPDAFRAAVATYQEG